MSELYLCELNKLKSIKSVCLENASQLSNCTTSASGPKFDSLPNCHQNGRPLALVRVPLPVCDSRACLMKEAQWGLPHKDSHFPRAVFGHPAQTKDITKPSRMRVLGLNNLPHPASSVWQTWSINYRKHSEDVLYWSTSSFTVRELL